MKVMEIIDREIVRHSLSCSPKSVWPASNWEIQGWRGFWRKAKSPVKKIKLQSAWLSVTSLFSHAVYSHRISRKEMGLCEHVPVVISFLFNCIKCVTCVQKETMGLWCTSAVSAQQIISFHSQWSWREQHWSSPEWRGHVILAPKRCPGNKNHTQGSGNSIVMSTFGDYYEAWLRRVEGDKLTCLCTTEKIGMYKGYATPLCPCD